MVVFVVTENLSLYQPEGAHGWKERLAGKSAWQGERLAGKSVWLGEAMLAGTGR